jgi:hypothetical protein
MYAVLLPVAIFLVVYYRRRDVYDLHHAILGDHTLSSPYCLFVKDFFYPICWKKSHNALCVFTLAGLLFSILVTAVITDSIKNAVGRPRPDFFWRCFPDGKDVCFYGPAVI